MTWYKVLGREGNAIYGKGTWNLPEGDTPGEWMPYLGGELRECVYGYHITDAEGLGTWAGPRIFMVEPLWTVRGQGDVWITPQARLLRETCWNTETQYKLIRDCIDHAHRNNIPSDKLRRLDGEFLSHDFSGYPDHVVGLFWSDVAQEMNWDAKWYKQRLLAYVHGSAVL